MSWYYEVGGKQQGPVSEDGIQDLIRQGSITAETLVWKTAMGDWREAGAVPGLLMPPPLPEVKGTPAEPMPRPSEGAIVSEGPKMQPPEPTSATPVEIQKATSVSATITTFFLAVALVFAVIGFYLFFQESWASTGTGIGMVGTIGLPEIISIYALFVYPLTGISFIVWFALKYRTTVGFGGEGLRYSNTWAVVGWLIPVANLFVPFQVASEIWVKSDEAVGQLGWPSEGKPGESVLGGWWTAFVLMQCLPIAALVAVEVGNSSAAGFFFVLLLVSVSGGAIAGIVVIQKIEKMQSTAIAGIRKPLADDLAVS